MRGERGRRKERDRMKGEREGKRDRMKGEREGKREIE